MLLVSDNSSKTLVLNTGLMENSKTYAIEVIISKNGKMATAKTRIHVADADFVDVDLR